MKISIISPDLSHNCLGRAHLLTKILRRHYEVEIVGPIFGNGIWEPLANDKSISYKAIKISGRFRPYWQIKGLAKKIDGDVVYASKPLFSSFGVGLLKKLSGRRPLILDIDDWQMGFVKDTYSRLSFARRLRSWTSSLVRFYSTDSYWNNLFGEKLTRLADKITVSNRFLQRKFGGEIVWHARDTEWFNPSLYDKAVVRELYGIRDTKKVVMFFGTPRAHKGIEDLLRAMELLKTKEILLVVVGIDYDDNYCQNMVETAKRKLTKERFVDFGLQRFEKVPEFLAMADVVVIPQRRNLATIGQVPAKVFDAMAMAKPIIATRVCDLPEVLEGCGWIVEPEQPTQLAEAIRYVFDHLEEAEVKGSLARMKCKKKYSYDAMGQILLEVFGKYE